MIPPFLLSAAVQLGLPHLRRLLDPAIGPRGGDVVTRIVATIAERAGTTPDGLEQVHAATPGVVLDAMKEVEKSVLPEMVPVFLADAEAARALADAEAESPWRSAWRPLGMYLILALWVWNIILLHVANAVWKIALPPVDFSVLLQFSVLYLGLYMGGHTVKDVATNVAKAMGKG
jgi:hypothetical protein